MKLFSSSVFCSLVFFSMSGQISFEKRYAGHPGAEVKALRQCFDHGYIMVGGDVQESDIIRTDEFGDSLWTKNYDTPGQFAFNVEQCRDSGFIITGYAFYNQCDAYLRKLDKHGNEEWFQYYDMNDCQWGQIVKELSNGDFIIGGTGMYRTDSLGNLIDWQNTSNQVMSLIITQDSHLVYTSTSSNTSGGGWLTKTDLTGNQVWSKHYSDLYFYNNCDNNLAETSDGGYIMVGRSASEAIGIMRRVNGSGDAVWTKNFRPGTVGSAMSVVQADSGGYLTAGFYVETQGSHAYLHRTNSDGDSLWSRVYDDAGAQSLLQTADEGYAFGGYKENSSGKRKFYLVKIGGEYPLSAQDLANDQIKIYPNPSSGQFHIDCEGCFGMTAIITDLSGHSIRQITLGQNIDLSELTSGVYLLRAMGFINRVLISN